jgi:hypothetical protein
MRLRATLGTPPALIGIGVFILVAIAALIVRAGIGDDPDGTTEVAGLVIERSEQATEPEPTASPKTVIVRPRPQRTRPADEPDGGEVVVAPPAPAPVPTATPSGGLVRDPVSPTPAPDDTDVDNDGNGSKGNGTKDPEPKPDPTTKPKPDPTPKPEPEPTPEPTEPEDTARYALREGDGHSRDAALADNGDWLFLRNDGHESQPQPSRAAQARLMVGFSDAALEGQGPVRDLSCHAVLTSGSRRLVTDMDHVFEISLWAADEYGVPTGDMPIVSVTERHAWDLPADRTRTMSMDPIELDAEDGVNYTCTVTYREL